MQNEQRTVLVLFGSTGDLSRLKLLPALRDMWLENILPTGLKLLVVGRRDWEGIDQYQEYIKQAEPHPFPHSLKMMDAEYIKLDFDDPGGFDPLWQRLKELKQYQILYYMAVGPEVLNKCVDRFEDPTAMQIMQGRQASILAEKPFGSNLEDAQQLNHRLAGIFKYPHVLRNDHYINRDTVQAITNLRQTNVYIAEVMKHHEVEAIELIVSEEVDLGSRVSYFDGRGMTVDWFQSHMLQMMATVCADLNTDSFCQAKAEFIESLELIPDTLIRGQYFEYKEAEDVPEDSETETFLALQMKSSRPDCENVIFRFIAGKALSHKEVVVRIHLKEEHCKVGKTLNMLIDPPGGHPLLQPTFKDEFEETLLNAVRGKTGKFVSAPEVEAQWQATEQVLHELGNVPLDMYQKGVKWEQFCSDRWCLST